MTSQRKGACMSAYKNKLVCCLYVVCPLRKGGHTYKLHCMELQVNYKAYKAYKGIDL
jgi:hypothetical protein